MKWWVVVTSPRRRTSTASTSRMLCAVAFVLPHGRPSSPTQSSGHRPVAENPRAATLATFVAFVVAGSVPLSPFVIGLATTEFRAAAWWSAILTLVVFAAIGTVKGALVGRRPLRSAVQTLAVGGLAAATAFVIGVGLRGIAG